MVNLFIALSLGVHREQLEHLIGLTWPRPFLLRPLWLKYQYFPPSLAAHRRGKVVLGRALLDHDCWFYGIWSVRYIYELNIPNWDTYWYDLASQISCYWNSRSESANSLNLGVRANGGRKPYNCLVIQFSDSTPRRKIQNASRTSSCFFSIIDHNCRQLRKTIEIV